MATKVEVKIQLGHKAEIRDVPTKDGYTHDWLVYVRGDEGVNLEHFVEKVVFWLHKSFKKPKRIVRKQPFELAESGYAGFDMIIDLHLRSKEPPKMITFDYDLFLYKESTRPVDHCRLQNLTFLNPSEGFRKKLLSAGGQLSNVEDFVNYSTECAYANIQKQERSKSDEHSNRLLDVNCRNCADLPEEKDGVKTRRSVKHLENGLESSESLELKQIKINEEVVTTGCKTEPHEKRKPNTEGNSSKKKRSKDSFSLNHNEHSLKDPRTSSCSTSLPLPTQEKISKENLDPKTESSNSEQANEMSQVVSQINQAKGKGKTELGGTNVKPHRPDENDRNVTSTVNTFLSDTLTLKLKKKTMSKGDKYRVEVGATSSNPSEKLEKGKKSLGNKKEKHKRKSVDLISRDNKKTKCTPEHNPSISFRRSISVKQACSTSLHGRIPGAGNKKSQNSSKAFAACVKSKTAEKQALCVEQSFFLPENKTQHPAGSLPDVTNDVQECMKTVAVIDSTSTCKQEGLDNDNKTLRTKQDYSACLGRAINIFPPLRRTRPESVSCQSSLTDSRNFQNEENQKYSSSSDTSSDNGDSAFQEMEKSEQTTSVIGDCVDCSEASNKNSMVNQDGEKSSVLTMGDSKKLKNHDKWFSDLDIKAPQQKERSERDANSSQLSSDSTPASRILKTDNIQDSSVSSSNVSNEYDATNTELMKMSCSSDFRGSSSDSSDPESFSSSDELRKLQEKISNITEIGKLQAIANIVYDVHKLSRDEFSEPGFNEYLFELRSLDQMTIFKIMKVVEGI